MLDFKDKKPLELSKIGDPFVNFVYSLALSKTSNKPLGQKVSNRILSEALVKAGLRSFAGRRMKKEDLGDYTEGLLFKAYVEGIITIEESVDILSKNISKGSSGPRLREESIKGFTELLNRVAIIWKM